MSESIIQIILQTLSVIDGLSVALIIGSITILAVLEITRVAHQEIDRGTLVARKILGLGILAQLVYRSVDFITTANLIAKGDVAVSDLSAIYLISLLMTVAAVVAFALHKAHKLQLALFVFFETALWYTMFVLSQFAARSEAIVGASAGVLVLITIIVVIFVLLVCDSMKRYYHKKRTGHSK
jgi:hypothetical protein